MTERFLPDSETLLEGFPHPAMILDGRGAIMAMNRLMEAMTGYTLDRVFGIHGELVLRSNTGNTRGQHYLKVLSQQEAMSVGGDIINRYRRKIPIQCTIAPLKGGAGEGGLLVVAEDVSVRAIGVEGEGSNPESGEFIGYSPKMRKVFDMIPLMAHTDASVLITGETGTGKDKIAEIIHRQSERARFPFIKVNCGALPVDLLESELFGHVKGAFTGATRNKSGMFQLADKGTLFLTEIGDMPLPLQVKLLSVLDDRRFMPVGGERSVSVDVRIIAATHRPLREQVKRNTFREDLFYRLNVLHIHMPPLRERESDVRYLLDHFLDKYTRALGKTIVGFNPSVMQTLLDYPYPGNVRELSNIVEYGVNICKRKKINKEHLPPYIFEKREHVKERVEEEIGSAAPPPEPAPVVEENGRTESGDSWAAIERQMIVDSLKSHGGNRNQAAETLGWGRMKLWRKMKKYKLL